MDDADAVHVHDRVQVGAEEGEQDADRDPLLPAQDDPVQLLDHGDAGDEDVAAPP